MGVGGGVGVGVGVGTGKDSHLDQFIDPLGAVPAARFAIAPGHPEPPGMDVLENECTRREHNGLH